MHTLKRSLTKQSELLSTQLEYTSSSRHLYLFKALYFPHLFSTIFFFAFLLLPLFVLVFVLFLFLFFSVFYLLLFFFRIKIKVFVVSWIQSNILCAKQTVDWKTDCLKPVAEYESSIWSTTVVSLLHFCLFYRVRRRWSFYRSLPTKIKTKYTNPTPKFIYDWTNSSFNKYIFFRHCLNWLVHSTRENLEWK